MMSDWRRASSIIRPRTIPRSRGAPSKRTFFIRYPITPKMDHDEHVVLVVAQAVRADQAEQKNEGEQKRIGDAQHLHPSPIAGRFKTSSMMLPMYMEMITPQKRSGLRVISKGPGCSPKMTSAPSIKAMTGLAGIPRVRRGMNCPAGPRVVRRLRAGHPFDGSLAEFLRMLGKTLFDGVRGEGGQRHVPLPGRTPRKNR